MFALLMNPKHLIRVAGERGVLREPQQGEDGSRRRQEAGGREGQELARV